MRKGAQGNTVGRPDKLNQVPQFPRLFVFLRRYRHSGNIFLNKIVFEIIEKGRNTNPRREGVVRTPRLPPRNGVTCSTA